MRYGKPVAEFVFPLASSYSVVQEEKYAGYIHACNKEVMEYLSNIPLQE